MKSSRVEFLDAAIEAIPQVAFTVTSDGHVDSLNAMWYAYTGIPSLADANPESCETSWWAAVHRDDARAGRRSMSAGAKAGKAFVLDLRLRQDDGVFRWFRVHVSPFPAASGNAGRWLGICTDIDDNKRLGQRFEFIARAGEVLAGSLDLQTTLDRLLAIIVPEFADWAAIDLFDDDDRLKTVAAIHADSRKKKYVKRLLGRYNHDPHIEPQIAEVLRKNRPIVLREVSSEQITKSAAPDFLDIIRELAPRSAVTVPLATHGRTIGSLVAFWAETPRRYSELDLPLFEELTRRAAVAIENARLYEREREVAAEFQSAALPISLPEVSGLRFNSIYVPANNRELLGGDWYDALHLSDGRIVVSVGDVAGNGLSAAVIMASMRQVIRGVAQVHADPVAMLDAADRTLKMEHPDTFVTAFVGVFDPIARTLTYASAGHPPPFLRDDDGKVTILEGCGLPLGLRVRGETATSVVLPKTGLVVFYSDGLVEAERDILRGYNRLVAALEGSEVAESSDPAESLYRAVLTKGNSDDVVVLTLRLDLPSEERSYALTGERSTRWAFDTADANAARSARDSFVAELRKGGVRSDNLNTAELLFGELLGNVVRYAPGKIEIIFDWSQTAPVLHVLDRGPGFTLAPKLPSDPLSERGRGLYIIWSLAEDLNVTERHDGGSHTRVVLDI